MPIVTARRVTGLFDQNHSSSSLVITVLNEQHKPCNYPGNISIDQMVYFFHIDVDK